MQLGKLIAGLGLVAAVSAQSDVSDLPCLQTCNGANTLVNKCGTQFNSQAFATCACANSNLLSQLLACCSSDSSGQQQIRAEFNLLCGSSSSASASATAGVTRAGVTSFGASATSVSGGSTSQQQSSPQYPSSTGLSAGAIAGIAVGCVGAVSMVLGAIGLCCFRRMYRRHRQLQQQPMLQQHGPPPEVGAPMPPTYVPSSVPSSSHPGSSLNPQNLDQHLASQEWTGIQQPVPQKQTAYQNATEHPPEPRSPVQYGQGSTTGHVTLSPQDAIGESQYGASQYGGSQHGAPQYINGASPVGGSQVGGSQVGGSQVGGSHVGSYMTSNVPETAINPASQYVWHGRV